MFRLLKADEIEMRVSTVNEKGSTWLLYKTARIDMDILDEMVGCGSWQCDYKLIKDVMYCGIGVKCDTEWVWKWDCGTESFSEAEKGQASDAFKRAGFKWGIGRELYTAPFIWISSEKVPVKQNNGKYACYEKLSVKEIEYIDGNISYLLIVDKKNEVVYEFGVKKTPVKTIIESIQSQMTVENALTFYGRAIKLYPDGTPEYKEWKKAWKKKNDELTSQKTEEHLNEEKEFLDSL